jgi:hypothetical protein
MLERFVDFFDGNKVFSLSFGFLVFGSHHNTIGALSN